MDLNFLVYGNPFPDHFLTVDEEQLQNIKVNVKHKDGTVHLESAKKGGTYLLQSRDEAVNYYSDISGGGEIGKNYTLGGSGTNVAKVLAMLFNTNENPNVSVKLVGRVNQDWIGDDMTGKLKNLGVTFLKKISETATGIVNCLVTPDTQRTMLGWLGAAFETKADDVQAKDMEKVDHVHVEGYFAYYGDATNGFALEKAVELPKQVNSKMTISLDLAASNLVNEQLERFLAVIEKVDFIFGNMEEFVALNSGKPITDEFYKQLFKHQVIVVTDGANGCFVKEKGSGKANHYPALKVDDVVDTTGAGDYFVAGFLYGYFKKMSIQKCVDIANFAATRIIRVLGADLDKRGWQELRAGITEIEHRPDQEPVHSPRHPGKVLYL